MKSSVHLNLILISPLMSVMAFAQEHGAAAEHGAEAEHATAIPWDHVIIPQAINFAIFAGILIFLLRNPIKNFFSSKEKEFLDTVRKAEEVKIQAEKAHNEVQSRLKNLESSSAKNVKEAEQEAAALRARLIKEAQEAAVKTEREAERTIHHEHERSIAALRSELVLNSMKFAQDKVKSSVNSGVINDLQQDFTRKVQSVRQ